MSRRHLNACWEWIVSGVGRGVMVGRMSLRHLNWSRVVGGQGIGGVRLRHLNWGCRISRIQNLYIYKIFRGSRDFPEVPRGLTEQLLYQNEAQGPSNGSIHVQVPNFRKKMKKKKKH